MISTAHASLGDRRRRCLRHDQPEPATPNFSLSNFNASPCSPLAIPPDRAAFQQLHRSSGEICFPPLITPVVPLRKIPERSSCVFARYCGRQTPIGINCDIKRLPGSLLTSPAFATRKRSPFTGSSTSLQTSCRVASVRWFVCRSLRDAIELGHCVRMPRQRPSAAFGFVGIEVNAKGELHVLRSNRSAKGDGIPYRWCR